MVQRLVRGKDAKGHRFGKAEFKAEPSFFSRRLVRSGSPYVFLAAFHPGPAMALLSHPRITGKPRSSRV